MRRPAATRRLGARLTAAMALLAFCVPTTIAAIVTVGTAQASSANPTRQPDALLRRDAGIDRVFALGATVVYHRTAGHDAWTRRINGRWRPAGGIPAGARGASIGRDAVGRTVVTVSTSGNHTRWWAYDVAADAARPLLGLRSCGEPGAVAIWGNRTAYFDDCATRRQTVVLQGPHRMRRFNVFSERGFEQVVLRGRSLAAMGEMDEEMTIFRLLDRGHPCHLQIGGGAADGPFWAQELSIAYGRLTWVMGSRDIF